MRQAYRFFLLLYPREHRERFVDEMTRVFEELSAEHREQGMVWYVRFAFGEMAGLIAGAAGAWTDRKPLQPLPAANSLLPPEVFEAQQLVERNVAAMVQAIAGHQFQRARALSDEERQARRRLLLLREKYGITN